MGSKRKRGGKEAAAPSVAAAPKRAKKSEASAAPVAPATPSFEKKPFIEMPTGPERQREAKLYEVLGSEDENERIQAADCIISSLLGDEPVPEAVLQRHLDRRLFRGLASGRNASRIGFSLVITEILVQLFGKQNLAQKHYGDLSFEKILGFLVDKTQAAGNVPGQEERDHYFGQLFGVECFVKSGIVFQDSSRWSTVLQLLLQLAYKKVWLRSQCGWVIVQAVEHMDKKMATSTLHRIAEAGLGKTPEGVAVWLVALDRFPGLSVNPWQHPLSKKTMGDLAAVLKESFGDKGEQQPGQASKTTKQANWTAQLHFVWDMILAQYLRGEAKSGDNSQDFELFWTRVVDDGFFSKNATDGQKFKGFMVFQKFLSSLVDHPSKLESLFSKNFMTCLINQAAKEDRYLHRAAIKTLKALESTVSEHPSSLVPILKNLVGENGVYNFDQRTNTKTVDRLLQTVDEKNGAACLEIIQKPVARLGQQESQEAQVFLKTYVDYLSKTLVSTASSGSEKSSAQTKLTSGAALQELSGLAYSQPKHIPQSLLTEQVRELCRSRLETSLAKLIRQGNDFAILCNAVLSMDTELVTMEDEITTVMKDARSRLQKLLKRTAKSDVEKSLTQGLAMLHAVSIFQLYNEDPDAMEVLQDLSQFSERLRKGKLDNDEGSSELLIEILLSMVARPSSLMRQVSQQVFETFTSQVSAEGLELLTGPLASDESTKGQQELFNTEDNDMAVDGDDDEEDDEDESNVVDLDEASDVEMDSDVEFVGLKQDQDSDDESSGDEDDDDDDDDDDDEKADGENGKKDGPLDLEELIGNILNSHSLDKDAEAESSEDDGDMSDSEMLALDEKLAEVIRPHVKSGNDSKKQKKDAKQSVVNFKHRILDLLEIFVKNEVLNPLAFALLIPLLNLMRTTSTKVLASRACEVILNYQKGLKKARGNKDEVAVSSTDDLLGVLVQVHEEAGKDNSHAYTKAASAASLIIASSMFSIDRDSVKQIAAVYAKTQSDWVLGQIKLQSSFFADWNNWCQNQASQSQS